MSDITVMGGEAEAEAALGEEAVPAAVQELRKVKYVQNIGRFYRGNHRAKRDAVRLLQELMSNVVFRD